MLSQFSYPIISSEKFSETVAFYEDHFGFTPKLEMDGFVVLEREDMADVYLGIINCKHKALPEAHRKPVTGLMLSYPVDNVIKFYDYAYHEGLTLLSEPNDALCGRKHFYVEDPNGVLVDVAENIDLNKIVSIEDCAALFVVNQA